MNQEVLNQNSILLSTNDGSLTKIAKVGPHTTPNQNGTTITSAEAPHRIAVDLTRTHTIDNRTKSHTATWLTNLDLTKDTKYGTSYWKTPKT